MSLLSPQDQARLLDPCPPPAEAVVWPRRAASGRISGAPLPHRSTEITGVPAGKASFAIFGSRGGAVAARRAHNPKVVSSNLTRATKARLGFSLLAGFALCVGVAACGTANNSSTNPPYASPQISPGDAVLAHSCDKVKAGKAPDGLADVKVSLIRQGTDLQRISDDLTGAVPGGNFGVDVELVVTNAQDVQTRIKTSNLCDPPKSQLANKAAALKDADVALKATGGGSAAAAALQAAQSAYNALNDLLGNLPK